MLGHIAMIGFLALIWGIAFAWGGEPPRKEDSAATKAAMIAGNFALPVLITWAVISLYLK